MELRTKLLRAGGEELVIRELGEPNLALLIERGALREGSVVLEAGEIGRCFSNVAKQWAAQRIGLVQIGFGYGLSDEGLWRGHALGRLDDGRPSAERNIPALSWTELPPMSSHDRVFPRMSGGSSAT